MSYRISHPPEITAWSTVWIVGVFILPFLYLSISGLIAAGYSFTRWGVLGGLWRVFMIWMTQWGILLGSWWIFYFHLNIPTVYL